jgi:hypothetical protein
VAELNGKSWVWVTVLLTAFIAIQGYVAKNVIDNGRAISTIETKILTLPPRWVEDKLISQEKRIDLLHTRVDRLSAQLAERE